jgi:hypothetical protein
MKMSTQKPIDNIRAAYGEPGVKIAESIVHVLHLAKAASELLHTKGLPEDIRAPLVKSLAESTALTITDIVQATIGEGPDGSAFTELCYAIYQKDREAIEQANKAIDAITSLFSTGKAAQ